MDLTHQYGFEGLLSTNCNQRDLFRDFNAQQDVEKSKKIPRLMRYCKGVNGSIIQNMCRKCTRDIVLHFTT